MVSAGLIITQVLNGLTIGLIYALIALGLTIVLGLMGVVNFAHGSFYMIGGYITFTITSSVLGNFWMGLIIGAFVSAMVGVGLFVSIIKPLRQRPPLEPMVVLVGVAMIFEQLIRSFWGQILSFYLFRLGGLNLIF